MSLWYEKYRPTRIDDYVWTNSDTRQLLVNWIEAPLEYPHLLLHGSTGTGKTTLAKIIREALELGSDAKFIPASLRSGVETIRDEIVGFCEAGGFTGMKLIVMDEADRLSRDAQEMLRNVIDRYQDDVRFIFTCNNLNKVIEPVRGRMWEVKIEALDYQEFLERLIDIGITEGIEMQQDGGPERLEAIIEAHYPNMRLAISEFQRSSVGGVLKAVEDIEIGDWEEQLPELMEAFSIHRAREIITGLRPDEYLAVYRYLYENANDLFGTNHGDAILVIADHIHQHSQSGHPDITLLACLVKLDENRE